MRVGLDLGGTKTDALVVDDADEVVGTVRLATGWGPDGVTRTITDAVAALAALPGVDAAAFRTVGVGMPGQVVPGSSHVSHALNLGVRELDVGGTVAPLLGLPVRVENDVKAAAVGAFALERRAAMASVDASGAAGPAVSAGSAPGRGRFVGAAAPASLAYLNLGTGVAAGVVIDGRLWCGARGTAGEVGHVSIDPQGPSCRCGGRGCIEAFAGGAALAERWGLPGELPVRDIFDAADAGEPRAQELRAGLASAAAEAVRILVLATDVDAVVIGGGLTHLRDRLLPDVRAALEANAAVSPFLRSLRLPERVRVLVSGSPAAALGAAIVGGTPLTEEVLVHG